MTAKRKRKPSIRDPEGTLYSYWNHKENDIEYHTPNGPDGHWINCWFTSARMYPGIEYLIKAQTSLEHWPGDLPGFLKELENRGYDPKTLRFQVSKNPDHPRWKK